jgi:hypothetical protein
MYPNKDKMLSEKSVSGYILERGSRGGTEGTGNTEGFKLIHLSREEIY